MSRIAIFLEAVYKQTHVAPQHQEYLFEGHVYVLEPSLPAQHIAHTTAHSPLSLFSMANETPKGLAFRDREWPLSLERVPSSHCGHFCGPTGCPKFWVPILLVPLKYHGTQAGGLTPPAFPVPTEL